jgi:hypothetical protein
MHTDGVGPKNMHKRQVKTLISKIDPLEGVGPEKKRKIFLSCSRINKNLFFSLDASIE